MHTKPTLSFLGITFLTATLISLAVAIPPSYASKTEIKVTGTVPSFGTYSVKGAVNFKIAKPGRFEIGKVTVYGTYNGPYPWIMRVYTDNTNYMPVAGSLATVSRAGLISDDGQFTVPLQINCPNLGADWAYIPDINDTGFKPYQASKEPGVATHTECLIMGIDPRNADWVSGPDRKLFTGDDNPLGDTTMTTPFDIRFAADFDDKTVRGSYTSNIYVELVPAP